MTKETSDRTVALGNAATSDQTASVTSARWEGAVRVQAPIEQIHSCTCFTSCPRVCAGSASASCAIGSTSGAQSKLKQCRTVRATHRLLMSTKALTTREDRLLPLAAKALS